MKERLDKCISSQLNISRAESQKLIRYGGVALNGRCVKDPSAKADGETDEIFIHRKKLEYKRNVYIELNKPLGVVSASNDKNDRTVIDLVPDEMKRKNLFPAGRLDKDTTGFVLITDDGQFAHDILSPKKHIKKTYIARADKNIDEKHLEILRNGLSLETVSFAPAEISLSEKRDDGYYWEIVLDEGKYHEIKRMIAFCSVELLNLHRIKMGNLYLDEALLSGECRLLTGEELKLVLESE